MLKTMQHLLTEKNRLQEVFHLFVPSGLANESEIRLGKTGGVV
ncbi:hypothetical protein [Salimicrobium flavidum]|uniref:Uncharacterized protein n=1 Tax=Salimicrobium flavidum TaxID=570947 RepID=A0A1N7KML4_9BACI|nr:hypothetical protein [Salimicrobium flavidum]SIS62797.1 hypothetical protein SAMN05421687_11414 [Salimicrobium flavidum]